MRYTARMLKRRLQRILKFIKSMFRRKRHIPDDSEIPEYDRLSAWAERKKDI